MSIRSRQQSLTGKEAYDEKSFTQTSAQRTEGGTGKISVYDKERDEVLDIPDEAEFLKAVTVVSDKEWDSIRLKEYMILEKGKGFYLLQGKWRKAKSGDVIAGYFIYEGQVELKVLVQKCFLCNLRLD